MIKIFLIHPGQDLIETVQNKFNLSTSLALLVPDKFHKDYLSLHLAEKGNLPQIYDFEQLESCLKPIQHDYLSYQLSLAPFKIFKDLNSSGEAYLLAKQIHQAFSSQQTPLETQSQLQELYTHWSALKQQQAFSLADTQLQLLKLFEDTQPVILSQNPNPIHYSSWFYQLHADARPIPWFLQCLPEDITGLQKQFQAFQVSLESYKNPKKPATSAAYCFQTLEDEIDFHLHHQSLAKLFRLPADSRYTVKIQDFLLKSGLPYYSLKKHSVAQDPCGLLLIQVMHILKEKEAKKCLQSLLKMPGMDADAWISSEEKLDSLLTALENSCKTHNAFDWCLQFEKLLEVLEWPSHNPELCEFAHAKLYDLAAMHNESYDSQSWLNLAGEILQHSPVPQSLNELPHIIIAPYSQNFLIPMGDQAVLGFNNMAWPLPEKPKFGQSFWDSNLQENYPNYRIWQSQGACFSMATEQHRFLSHPGIPHWEIPVTTAKKSQTQTVKKSLPEIPSQARPLKQVSITGIEAFQRCNYQFYLSRIVKVPELDFGQELYTASDWGTCVHKMIEEGLQHALQDSFAKDHFLQAAAEAGQKALEAQQLNPLQLKTLLKDGGMIPRLSQLFAELLGRYHLIATEYPIQMKHPKHEKLILSGTIDLLLQDRHNKSYLILDIKTGKNLPGKIDINSYRSLQLGFYSWLISKQMGKVAAAAFIHSQLSELGLQVALCAEDFESEGLLHKSRQSITLDYDYFSGLSQRLDQNIQAIQQHSFMLNQADIDPFLTKNRAQLACTYCSYQSMCDEPKRYQGQR